MTDTAENTGRPLQLNQVVAIEKGVKNDSKKKLDALYHNVQKPDLFNGFTKQYQPLNEEDVDVLPPETQRVRLNAEDVLNSIGESLTELFDITADKDFANTQAKADVVVDGTVFVKDAPVTYLLFLEKQLEHLKTVVGKVPVLSVDHDWKPDVNTSLFKTNERVTVRTKKVQEGLVLQPPTKEHPAQTQLISKDVITGHWKTVGLSGALPEPRRRAVLDKIEKLRKAVKFAREEANRTTVERKNLGGNILGWLFTN